jgi:hypothetical protein
MSSIVPATNTVDWLSGAWSFIQSSSSSTGVAILDALSSSSSSTSTISAGLSDSAFNALSSALTSVAQYFIEQQNILVGQAALARVQKEAAAALQKAQSQALSSTGNIVNVKA